MQSYMRLTEAGINGGQMFFDFETPDWSPHLLNFLELILNNIYSGIIVCNRDTRIIFANEVYANLLKTDRKKILGRKIEDFFPASRLGRVIASGKAELGQRCALKTDTPLLVNRIPLKHKGKTTGAILQTVFRDFKQFTDLVNRLNLLETEINFYKKGLKGLLAARYTFDSIIGESRPISNVRNQAKKYAQTNSPVLITGATGTGKELFAHGIHNASARNHGPFVCVNAAALPRELLESELFGYTAGAFTGASIKGKVGKIELAHQGTLFLDEIGELPIASQAKLLRILDTQLLDKIGSTRTTPLDFRLVAATNRNIPELIKRRRFRDDLFYRLNTMMVEIPTLLERREDIPLLANHYLQTLGRSDLQVSDEVWQAFNNHDWPGNIRELKNVINRAVSLADGNAIEMSNLPDNMHHSQKPKSQLLQNPNGSLADEMVVHEKKLLADRLEECGHNMAKTARSLHISRSTLYEKCRRHNLIQPAA